MAKSAICEVFPVKINIIAHGPEPIDEEALMNAIIRNLHDIANGVYVVHIDTACYEPYLERMKYLELDDDHE